MTDEIQVTTTVPDEPNLLMNLIKTIIAYYDASEEVKKIPDGHYVALEIKMKKLPDNKFQVYQPNVIHLIPQEDEPRIITSRH